MVIELIAQKVFNTQCASIATMLPDDADSVCRDIFRILINQCKDILKERKKVVPIEEFPELIHEDHYFTNEWRKILSNLNGKYQIVMELYYVDGFSTKEIARMLHITEVNVRSRMVRGRKQLEQILTARAMD